MSELLADLCTARCRQTLSNLREQSVKAQHPHALTLSMLDKAAFDGQSQFDRINIELTTQGHFWAHAQSQEHQCS